MGYTSPEHSNNDLAVNVILRFSVMICLSIMMTQKYPTTFLMSRRRQSIQEGVNLSTPENSLKSKLFIYLFIYLWDK